MQVPEERFYSMKKALLIGLIIYSSCSNRVNNEQIQKNIEYTYNEEKYSECVDLVNAYLRDSKNRGKLVSYAKTIKANCLIRLGKYADCINVVDEVFSEFRQTPELLALKERSYEYLGLYDSALYNYTIMIERFKHIDGYNYRSLIYFRLDSLKLSEKDADSALSIDSLNLIALNNKGINLLWQSDKLYESISIFRKCLTIENNPMVYFNIGDAYNRLKIHDSACYYWRVSAIKGLKLGREYYNGKCFDKK